MLDVLPAAVTRLFDSQEPQDVAVATIIATEGSVPRPAGTSMLVDTAGGIVGSLTGGCVEGAVLEACQDALATGEASVQEFGYSDEDAFSVGLMCGGRIDVLIQPFRAGCSGLRAESETVAVVLRLPSDDDAHAPAAAVCGAAGGEDSGPSTDALAVSLGAWVPEAVVETAAQRVGAFIRRGRTGSIRLAPPEGGSEPIELFVETRMEPAHLLVVGANVFSIVLVEAA